MTTTVDYPITYEDGWVEVSDGAPSVTAQLKTDGPVMLQVATAQPASDSFAGFILSADSESSFAGNALAATDKCFLRVLREGDSEVVAVMVT